MARLSRFFVDKALHIGGNLIVDGNQSHYILRVLRLSVGNKLTLFNDGGGEYLGEITEIRKTGVHISLLTYDAVERESRLKIDLALACLKREKMDLAIQKATELGVTSICPVISEFSAVKGHVLENRRNHWQGVIDSSCEQCGRNTLPRLDPLRPFSEWISKADSEAKLICEPVNSLSIGEINNDIDSISLAIGPEGGFSQAELSLATANDFVAINLGPRILRAETAVVTSLSLVQSRWGDL